MDAWRLVAERKILEAMAEGAFDHLPGAGKPLDLRENPFEDPSDRMAHRLLRNNGFAPQWIEEAKEIEAEYRRVRAEGRVEGKVSTDDFRARVAALNRKIFSFNLKVPVTSVQKRPFEIGS